MSNKKQWDEMNRKEKTLGLIGLVVIVLIILGVISAIAGGGNTKHNLAKSSPITSTNKQAVTAEPSTSKPTLTTPVLTGYGALQHDWNTNHQEDTRYNKGSVYNPDPGLGYDPRYDAKYYAVIAQNGRILNYSMRLPNGSTLAAAQAEAMQEFPSDASIIWQKAQTGDPTNACYQMEVKSATLGTLLSDPAIGDSGGEVFVEFYTDTAQSTTDNSDYSPSNVNGALLQLGSYQTAADAPGC